MKKTLIALGLMSAFGAVHAESSVTLYGNINVAVTKKGSAGVTLKGQEYRYASHIGFTGKEDLGNGYAAIFKLEAELEPDTGSGVYGADKKQFGFNRHSYVGLVTPYGAFRFGRSTTPFVNMWIGGGFGEGRGIGEFTAGLVGTGLRTTQPEVGARWNNAMFYDVKKGGFAAGLAVTTKGSQSLVPANSTLGQVDNEGASGTKPAYGAYARYEGKSGMWGYKVGGAYQVDNGSSYANSTAGLIPFFSSAAQTKNAPAESKNAWILATGLSYGPAALSVGYAQSKIDNTDLAAPSASKAALRTGKSKTLFASLGYDVTPNDHVYASYGRYKRHNNYQFATGLAGEGDIAGSQYSVGYEHRLSKRTVIYANVRKVANITNSCAAKLGTNTLPTASPYYAASCGVAIATVNSVLDTEKDWSYDIGISHKF